MKMNKNTITELNNIELYSTINSDFFSLINPKSGE